MVDTLTKQQRSDRMSRIRSKNTKPELLVRKALWAAGYRYRLHGGGLPGKPDIVLPKHKVAIFVHGCYWHGHSCQSGRIPGSNSEFWRNKFLHNKARDQRNTSQLQRAGWHVLVVWECSLATKEKRAMSLARLLEELKELQVGP